MYLVDFIDNPRPKICSPSFKDKMDISKRFFPLFHAYCEETDPQLHTMSKEERLGLKLKLLDEVRAKMDETKKAVAGEKRLGDIVLPYDPEECMKVLRDMINECQGKTEVNQDLCNFAVQILMLMKLDQDQFAVFNENLFNLMPKDESCV